MSRNTRLLVVLSLIGLIWATHFMIPTVINMGMLMKSLLMILLHIVLVFALLVLVPISPSSFNPNP